MRGQAMTPRQRETLWGALTGGTLGCVVWIVGKALYLPVYPSNVAELTGAPSILGGAFAGALIIFFSYEQDNPRWRRRSVQWLIAAAAIGVTGLIVGGRYTAVHDGERTIWAAGFGATPPFCAKCQAKDETTRSNLDSCVSYLTQPDIVRACFGASNVRRTSIIVGASAVLLAFVAAMLGALLLLTRALERNRIVQFDDETQDTYNTYGRAFQKIVRPENPLMDYSEFETNLRSLRRRVCRIQSGNAPIGTGFLIGPDLMITNHHVLRDLFASRITADVMRCVFDVVRNEEKPPREVRFAPEWDVLHSPPSDVDSLPDPKGRDPRTDELDFAVVRLAEPIGAEPLSEDQRGWFYLPDWFHAKPGHPLVIAQHPGGRPLEIALDTDAILLVNQSETRVRYRTNTDNGSSGSPCLDMTLKNIVAIHHSGDPNCRPAYNEGIPIHKIRACLVSAGVSLEA